MTLQDLPRPLPPTQADCCRGDCGSACVFAVYERALERWLLAQEVASDAPPSSEPG